MVACTLHLLLANLCFTPHTGRTISRQAGRATYFTNAGSTHAQHEGACYRSSSIEGKLTAVWPLATLGSTPLSVRLLEPA